MNNIPSSQPPVPSIHIQGVDDSALYVHLLCRHVPVNSTLSLASATSICSLWTCSLSTTSFPKTLDFMPVHNRQNVSYTPLRCGVTPIILPDHSSGSSNSPALEDIPELSHLNTMLTGPDYTFPISTIIQDNCALSPSSLGSPAPSPTSSFASLSPSSFYDPIGLSDSEVSPSPSPATPDQQFPWQVQHQSTDSLLLHPSFMGQNSNDSILPSGSLGPPTHRRSKSSPSRHGPVASKAMLEANSRRRRHPAQFECPECNQTFTALFSLKRESLCILHHYFIIQRYI